MDASCRVPMYAQFLIAAGIAVFMSLHARAATGSPNSVIDARWAAMQPQLTAAQQSFLSKTYVDPWDGRTMKYRLFVPPSYVKGTRAPLVMYLHGNPGGSLTPYWTEAGLFALAESQAKLPCFVVVPEINVQTRLTNSMMTWDSHAYILMQLLDELSSTYDIDAQRLYLSGFSMGGGGTFGIGTAYPYRWAAIVPVAGYGNTALASRLVEQKVGVFATWGAQDAMVPFSSLGQPWIDKLTQLKADFDYIVYPEANHPQTDQATYTEPGLVGWMAARRRSAVTGVPQYPPLARSDFSYKTNSGVARKIRLVASDPNGDNLTYSLVSNPAHGTLSGTAPLLTYTPKPGFAGVDFIKFKASDGVNDSNEATISICVGVDYPVLNAAPGANGAEPSTKGSFVISVSAAYASDLEVNYIVSPGNPGATPAADYVPLRGVAVIPAGSKSTTVDVVPLGDSLAETTEYVRLSISTDWIIQTRMAEIAILDGPIVVPPAFTVQPQNKTVTVGQTASFSATISGAPPPTLQWQKSTDNGVTWTSIAGATGATYMTPAAVLADNGTKFRCTATNAGGNATSTSATLTVLAANNPPTIQSGAFASPNPVSAGQSTSLTVTATDADGDPLSFSWSFGDGSSGAGASVSHTYPASGTYLALVTVSDGKSSVQSSVSVTVSAAGNPRLAAHWTFDETAGLNAADRSGNGNTGTLVNGSSWSAGKIAGGLRFDGVDDYVECANNPSLNPVGQLSLSAWVNADTATSSKVIVSKANGSVLQYTLVRFGNGSLRFNIGTTSGIAGLSSVTALAANRWYHVAATYDGSTIRLFIDGVLNASVAKSGAMSDCGRGVRIGAGTGTESMFFKGSLDDLRIYNQALSAAEISALANAGAAPAAASVPTERVIDLGVLTLNKRTRLKLPLPDAMNVSGRKRFAIVAGDLPSGLRLTSDKLTGIPTESGTFIFSMNISNKRAAAQATYFLTVQALK
ncbi:MAG TPA: LamG-like jellyroll fold domain-containing protein [Planctomycetota bacterium]|nr:LamG-like jellyroll fold domain-containing protein [Planctomycetota bacterium]